MRIAELNQIFGASHGGMPFNSSADTPFNPARP